jgi:hypothetical protein
MLAATLKGPTAQRNEHRLRRYRSNAALLRIGGMRTVMIDEAGLLPAIYFKLRQDRGELGRTDMGGDGAKP